MKNKDKEDAPNFCFIPNDQEPDSNDDQVEDRMKKVETFADFLISTNPEDIKCYEHEVITDKSLKCEDCRRLREKVEKYQTHKHTFTCAKKRQTITIQENEGHGKLDGCIKGHVLSNISVCRFKFPKFPLDETRLIASMPKETDEDLIKKCKADLSKITKYLIRQTYSEDLHFESESCQQLK